MKYFEITTDASCRPNYPEDNMVIVKGKDMKEALELFYGNRGDSTVRGNIIKCREIWYVKEWEVEK